MVARPVSVYRRSPHLDRAGVFGGLPVSVYRRSPLFDRAGFFGRLPATVPDRPRELQ